MQNKQQAVAIIGGGVMGAGIAAIFGAGGWHVHVMSPTPATRESLPARVRAAQAQIDGAPANIALQVHASLDALPWSNIDFVVEAVTEELALKQTIFAQLEALSRPDTPLASNASIVPISQISAGLNSRGRMLGLHFFMPAHLVPLVEVVSGADTDAAVAEQTCALMRALGKEPIHVKKDIPGFVGNRIQHAMMREALYLVQDGIVSPEDVDRAVRYGFGFRFMACGPMMQKEMSGWDTNFRSGNGVYPHLHNEDQTPPIIGQMVEEGRYGMKSGHGFWDWTPAEVDAEKARIEAALQQALKMLNAADRGND